MDKSTSGITGYIFAKRIVDYYGTDKERGAGDVLLEKSQNQWCDWIVRYDSFYLNPQGAENKGRFTSIIKDICALYNTRGGVVLIEIDGSDPHQVLRKRGLQDYVKHSCDQMCKHNTLLRTREERKKIRRIFEARLVRCKGGFAVSLLVKTADDGLRYPVGDDTNHYYVRDEDVKDTRMATVVITANSELGEYWDRECYLKRDDLRQKLVELNLPIAPPRHCPALTIIRNALTRKHTARDLFSVMIRASRFGLVVMTLIQFLPISYETCRDGGLTTGSALKTFIIGLVPFVAPYWAARGAIHGWGVTDWMSYLIFFWPYVLYACACLFTALHLMVVKRETVLIVGKGVVILVAVCSLVGLSKGYVFYRNRIQAIGGYEASQDDVKPVIGMNELVVRSVEAVECEFKEKYDAMQTRDVYGIIKWADFEKRIKYLQMLSDGLNRVKAMYASRDGRRTQLVEALGGPDQGLIDCLSDLSEAVSECMSIQLKVRKSGASFDEDVERMWQKANVCNRRFFARANELGIYNSGN